MLSTILPYGVMVSTDDSKSFSWGSNPYRATINFKCLMIMETMFTDVGNGKVLELELYEDKEWKLEDDNFALLESIRNLYYDYRINKRYTEDLAKNLKQLFLERL